MTTQHPHHHCLEMLGQGEVASYLGNQVSPPMNPGGGHTLPERLLDGANMSPVDDDGKALTVAFVSLVVTSAATKESQGVWVRFHVGPESFRNGRFLAFPARKLQLLQRRLSFNNCGSVMPTRRRRRRRCHLLRLKLIELERRAKDSQCNGDFMMTGKKSIPRFKVGGMGWVQSIQLLARRVILSKRIADGK